MEEGGEEGSITLTDGKVRLIIRRCHNGYYRSLRQGFDHIGFKVESVEKTKKDLEEIAANLPECAPKKIGGGPPGRRPWRKTWKLAPSASTPSPIRTACCWIFRSN